MFDATRAAFERPPSPVAACVVASEHASGTRKDLPLRFRRRREAEGPRRRSSAHRHAPLLAQRLSEDERLVGPFERFHRIGDGLGVAKFDEHATVVYALAPRGEIFTLPLFGRKPQEPATVLLSGDLQPVVRARERS